MFKKIINVTLFIIFIIIYERFLFDPIQKLLAKIFKKYKAKHKEVQLFRLTQAILKLLFSLPGKIFKYPPKS